MPRSKNQQHHHWDIDDPHHLLGRTRQQVQVYKAHFGVTQPQAVAELIGAGYNQLLGFPLPERENTQNSEQSGTDKRRSPGKKAA